MKEIVLILQNIRSLDNVGSIFRTADVFKVSKIYLCGYTGTPPRHEISKVALGAEEWIPWEQCKQTHVVIKRLRKEGYKILALETGKGAKKLGKKCYSGKVALILGNEVKGITPAIQKRADDVVEIPMCGKKESLNVSVAAGVALYALRCCNNQ